MRKILSEAFVAAAVAALVVFFVVVHRDLWLWKTVDEKTTFNWLVLVPLAAFVSLVGLSVVVNIDRLARYLTLRRIATFANVLLMSVLALAIVIFANVLGARRYARSDWTFRNTYTITERTRHILDSLPKKVVAHVFVPPENPFLLNIRGMLDTYHAAAREKLDVDYLNPGRDRDALDRKLLALGIDPKKLPDPDVVIFEAVDPDAHVPRTKYVTMDELVERDYSMGPQNVRLKGFKGEELFTKAILDVTREKPTSVYFLSGHSEFDAYSSQADERVKALDTALRNLNYDVKPLKLDFAPDSKTSEVPEDCDVLCAIGAKGRFDDREIAALKAYLEKGGRMLVMAEPVVKQRPGTTSVFFDETRLDALLKDYGVSIEQAMIHDPASAIRDFIFQARFEADAAQHTITKPLAGLAIVFAEAVPVTVLPPDESGKVHTQTLLETLPSAIAVKNLDAVLHGKAPEAAADRKGPFPLAVAVTKDLENQKEARLVVTGDASIAADELTTRFLGQMNFVLNSIAWLAERQETISIEAKAPEILRLQVGPDDTTRLKLLSLLDLPLACCAIALGVWVARRR